MSTIVVNPQALPEEPTSELVSLQIYVKEEDWRGYFDQIQVFRSRSGSAGPYEELTASQMRTARLPITGGPPASISGQSVALVGTTLELLVNERDAIVVAFTGSDPLTFAAAAAQVILQGRNKLSSWVDAEGSFVVSTTDVGTGAVLQVTGGNAAPQLGLATHYPANLDYGEDARVPLQVAKEVYLFNDIRGSRKFFYKTRFLNKTNGATSDFSAAFSAGQAVGISQSNLVCGFLCLVDATGKPLKSQAVHLHVEYNGSTVEGKVVAGGDETHYTDENGRVEFTLVRGQLFSLAVPGTNLNRQFVSPTDPSISSFNLLDPSVGTGQDMFRVAVPNLVVAERRTL